MKRFCLLLVLMIVVVMATATAAVELTTNGDFDGNIDGWTFWVSADWAGNYNATYDVAYFGWSNARAMGQNTGAKFQANTIYTFKTAVSAATQNNTNQYEGAQLALSSIVDGVWEEVDVLDYMFPAEDRLSETYQPGTFREMTLTLDTTAGDLSVVGKDIGVAVRGIDNTDWGANGWMYVQSISLEYLAAEPTSPANDADVTDDVDQVGSLGDNGIDVSLNWITMRDPQDDPNFVDVNPLVTAHYVRLVENEPNFASSVLFTVDNGSVGETGSLLIEDLNPDSVYYWRVDEAINGKPADDPNTVQGPVWAFETIPTAVTFTDHPADVLVADGGSAEFSVGAFSITPVSYAWYHSDDLVQDPLTDTGFGTDANTVTLTDITLADGDEQTYVYCVANNGGGDTYSEMALVEIERLMGHWTLDSTLDSTPSGQPGTAEQTSFVAGIDGNAAEMPGEPNYIVTITDSEESYNNFHLGLSVSMSINTTYDNWQILAGKQDRSADPRGAEWTFNLTPEGKVQLNGTGGGISSLTSDASVNDGVWHLVTATFDGAVRKIYIDGVIDKESASQGAIDPENMNTHPFEIGGESATEAATAQSLIDDVQIYNYALAATDVVDIYNESYEPINVCILEYASNVDVANSDTGLVSGDEGFEPDCKINIDDFAAMAAGWLECGLYPVCP